MLQDSSALEHLIAPRPVRKKKWDGEAKPAAGMVPRRNLKIRRTCFNYYFSIRKHRWIAGQTNHWSQFEILAAWNTVGQYSPIQPSNDDFSSMSREVGSPQNGFFSDSSLWEILDPFWSTECWVSFVCGVVSPCYPNVLPGTEHESWHYLFAKTLGNAL